MQDYAERDRHSMLNFVTAASEICININNHPYAKADLITTLSPHFKKSTSPFGLSKLAVGSV